LFQSFFFFGTAPFSCCCPPPSSPYERKTPKILLHPRLDPSFPFFQALLPPGPLHLSRHPFSLSKPLPRPFPKFCPSRFCPLDFFFFLKGFFPHVAPPSRFRLPFFSLHLKVPSSLFCGPSWPGLSTSPFLQATVSPLVEQDFRLPFFKGADPWDILFLFGTPSKLPPPHKPA